VGKDRKANKVAIVSGAGQGIGEAIAKLSADEHTKVVVATRTENNRRNTVKQIKNVSKTFSTYGWLDVMVHKAASFPGGMILRV